jgi:protein TonB
VAGSVSQQSIELADTTKYELPFMKVEVKPVFMGGDENTFTRWVAERLVYPPEAKASTIQGRVILQFLIDKKGNVKNVKVLRGVHKLLDEEAVRVVSLSPPWTPGKEKGETVSVVYVFPVIFQLR